MASRLELRPLQGIPLVAAGDDLADILLRALADSGAELAPGDVLVIAQKIVSKAEGRSVPLAEVRPSPRARELAERTAKDPRLVELILQESEEIVRMREGEPGVIVVAHKRGWVHANAGIDQSNVRADDAEEHALLLPEDPDASARALRARLHEATGVAPGVVISDSAGRAWRVGTVGIALGSAGITALADLRGTPDLYGRPLEVTQVGRADELAAAAGLVMGQAGERAPAVLVRGLPPEDSDQGADALIRPKAEDLFR